MTRRRRLNFKYKLFISYSLVVVIIMVLVTMALSFYIKTIMKEQQTATMLQIVQKTGDQIDEFLTNMSEVAIQTGLNPTCVEAFMRLEDYPITGENRFETTGFASTYAVMRTLATFKTMHFGSGRISLYDEWNNYVGYGIYDSSQVRHRFLESSVLRTNAENLAALGGKTLLILPHQDYWNTATKTKLVSALWKITDLDTGKMYGYVEVQQSFSEITKLLPVVENTASRIFLFSSDGTSIIPDTSGEKDTSGLFDRIAEARGQKTRGNGVFYASLPDLESRNIVAWSTLKNSGWLLAYAHDVEDLFQSAKVTSLLVFGAGLLALALCLGVVFLISGHLSAPIRNLCSSLAAVNLDNLVVNLPHEYGDDDISRLNEAFASMFYRLKRSTNQLIRSRDHEVKAHLLALQSQIDPHFIFNVLSVIKAGASDIKADKIVDMCTKLAAILRYVSDFERGCGLMGEEVSHARTYMELMKYRYEEGFDYHIEEEPRIDDLQVPKFFLQPVVENCFKHGFSLKRPPWHVGIKTSVRGDFWIVEVEDNGHPIPTSVIDELNRKADAFIEDPSAAIQALKIGGLGLFNSLVRLRLRYGSDAIFQADSSAEGGTRIVLGGRRS